MIVKARLLAGWITEADLVKDEEEVEGAEEEAVAADQE
jgi:N utilization substance protein A